MTLLTQARPGSGRFRYLLRLPPPRIPPPIEPPEVLGTLLPYSACLLFRLEIGAGSWT